MISVQDVNHVSKEQKSHGTSTLIAENLGLSGVKFVVDGHTSVWRR